MSRAAATWRGTPAYLWLFLLGLTANVFSGNTTYLGLPIGPDRVLVPLAVVLALLDPRSPRLHWRGLFAAMMALTAWATYSAMTADTLATPLGFYALVDRLVMPFVLFAAAPLFLGTTRHRVLFLRFLVLITLYLGFTAVFEMIGPRSLVFPRYIMDPSLGIMFGRARGPFLSAEANGMVMATGAIASILLAARVRGAWRLLTWVACAVGLLGCLLTLTRSVWVAPVLALTLLAWMLPRYRKVVSAAFVGVAVAGSAMLVASPALASALVERATTGRSLYDRQNTNDAALRIISDRPLDGIGWSRFVTDGADWIRQGDYPVTSVRIEVHNVVLSRAAELGLPAAALFALIVLAGPVRAALHQVDSSAGDLRYWRVLVACSLAVWVVPVMFSPNPYPFPNNVVWLMAGVLVPGAARIRHRARETVST